MKVLSLSELCERMHKRGYQFARLAQVTPPPGADPDALLLLQPHATNTKMKSTDSRSMLPRLMEDGLKPIPAWYFSEIEWDHTERRWTLSWAEWCKDEHFHVEDNAMRPICFAKFNTQKLVFDVSKYRRLPSHPNHTVRMMHHGHSYYSLAAASRHIAPDYDWNRMNDEGYHGVHVGPNDYAFIEGQWAVPTVAVWKPQGCVFAVQYFHNAGPWAYQV